MSCLKKSARYTKVRGLFTEFAGAAPKVLSNDSIICGFGDRLVCFSNQEDKIIWQWSYPQIKPLALKDKVQVFKIDDSGKKEKELVYETDSEITINSNVLELGAHLYFVLSEKVYITNYVVKIDKYSGKTIWVFPIKGDRTAFKIFIFSKSELLLQNERYFWIISEDGNQVTQRDKFVLDLDCTTCSDAVQISKNQYVVNSDLGIHVFNFNLDDRPHCAVSSLGRNGAVDFSLQPTIDDSPPDPKSYEVFLSHASEDKKAIVTPFYEACKRNGISAWYDTIEIQWGDSLVKKIQGGLAKSKMVLLFISKSSLEKKWPEKEIDTALSLENSYGKKVLPLVLGLSHEELTSKYPLIASKVYRCVKSYNLNEPVCQDEIDSLVMELSEVLKSLGDS
jgi:hypothetical protein